MQKSILVVVLLLAGCGKSDKDRILECMDAAARELSQDSRYADLYVQTIQHRGYVANAKHIEIVVQNNDGSVPNVFIFEADRLSLRVECHQGF